MFLTHYSNNLKRTQTYSIKQLLYTEIIYYKKGENRKKENTIFLSNMPTTSFLFIWI